MQKQTIEFVVKKKNGIITKISKSNVLQPKTNFNSKGIKWYEDKQKKQEGKAE